MRTESKKKELLTAVKAINPLAPYFGGKRCLAKTIIPLIEKVPHEVYIEPFMGMGGIFFRRTAIPKAEVINDINKELVTLYRVLERFPHYFLDMLKFKICTRAEFERFIKQPPELLTDLERAARFLYLQKNAFGGKVTSQSFGVSATRPARFDMNKIETHIEDMTKRLRGVVIECLPYDELIARYDKKESLFYLDPPYWNCENDYGKNIFSKQDFTNMAKLLGVIKGKFIMSINDVPEIREIFKKFHIMEVKTRYSVRVGACNEVTELLISNVDLNGL